MQLLFWVEVHGALLATFVCHLSLSVASKYKLFPHPSLATTTEISTLISYV